VTRETQDLLTFVRQLPEGIAFCPIYAKGTSLKSGRESKGKTPLELSHHQSMGPADVALYIERQPQLFQAVGAFTGPRSGGLVILDVDANLSALKRKRGETLETAPCVTSTKANAAKYFFRVPEGLWDQVKGFGLTDSGQGYEVLWGRQGLLYGAYPGSSDGKAPEGFYGFTGDLEAIPEAPAWLVAEMKAAKHAGFSEEGFIKNRKALQFGDRTQEEVAEIIQCCLNVIPQQGAGSRDHWIRVGMAIHSELPNEVGLTLWSAWSAEDPEYADDWDGSNPCEEVWRSFKPNGPITLGSLFWLADQQDPARRRFPEDLRKVIEEAEGDRVQKTRMVHADYTELLNRARKIQEIENPAEQNHKMHLLALEAGYRDAGPIERLLIADAEFQLNGGELTGELLFNDTPDVDYLIPDLIPIPATIMLHGEGGNGKSAFAATLARHVLRADPFSVRGQFYPVNGGKPGKVLWLNGDQSRQQLRSTLKAADLIESDMKNFVPQQGWELQWYGRFTRLVQKHKPQLVIIDSITGCSKGSAFSENQKEFAAPVYWLALNNGTTFPACSIILLHHSNKTGGYRGTSSLKDATDETWGIAFSKTHAENRVITVEKSRAGRKGRQMLLQLTEEMDFRLKDIEPELDSSPAGFEARILAKLHAAGGRWVARTELAADPSVGMSVKALRKRLERLVEHQLVEVRVVEERQGSPRYEFRVQLQEPPTPAGGVVKKRATLAEPALGLNSEGGAVCIRPPSNIFEKTRLGKKVEGGPIETAPPSTSSGGQGSSRVAEISKTHTGEEAEQRSTQELDLLEKQTGWD
jgi:hypothetical protein